MGHISIDVVTSNFAGSFFHVGTSKYKAPISAGSISIYVVISSYKAPISVGHFSIDVVTLKDRAPISAGHFSFM